MKIIVKKTRAWESDGAPAVWGFYNVPVKINEIFKKVSKLTESAHTQEHSGKFYYNGIGAFWYTRDKRSVDIAKQMIEEQYPDIQVNVNWNIF